MRRPEVIRDPAEDDACEFKVGLAERGDGGHPEGGCGMEGLESIGGWVAGC